MLEDNNDSILDFNIWKTTDQNGNWSKPELCEFNSPYSEIEFSFSDKGNIYLSRLNSDTGLNDIFMIQKDGDSYRPARSLGEAINTSYDDRAPYIAPDESYLIFSSNRPGGLGALDFYISFNENGKWSEAINMTDKVNSRWYEISLSVLENEQHIFFTSFTMQPYCNDGRENIKFLNGTGNVFWINASLIEELKEKNTA